jgi:hypothetical protein
MLIMIGCRSKDLEKPSLLLKYYNGSSDWAGIILGETTLEETQNILVGLDEFEQSSINESSTALNFDEGVCVDFIEGFRESGFCIHYLDGKAVAIGFLGPLKIEQINQYLGPIEKIGLVFLDNTRPSIGSYGISESAGYVLTGDTEEEKVDETTTSATITSETLAYVSLVDPDLFEFYMVNTMLRTGTVEYLFKEGGFEDWRGPGEYEVYFP